jgi:hypothetical protein
MKFTLYCVQEIHNESFPDDCCGELHIFTTEKARQDFLESVDENDEYTAYVDFEKKITVTYEKDLIVL